MSCHGIGISIHHHKSRARSLLASLLSDRLEGSQESGSSAFGKYLREAIESVRVNSVTPV